MATVTREHLAGLQLARERVGYSNSETSAWDKCDELDDLIAQASAAPEQAKMCDCNQGRLPCSCKRVGAAPEQEAVAWVCPQQLQALKNAPGSATCAAWNAPGRSRVALYTHADPSEVERLRAELAKAQALLAKVINSGALSDDQHEELEADICAVVDVVATLKKQDFADHLESEAEKAIAMPDYKRECVKSPARLSATAQPAECCCPKIGEPWNPDTHALDCPVHAQPAEVKS